ncbi:hypothetical protein E0E52_13430 [Azotobacter chroococcum]|uniref:helix-turn-helix transcriptional regulator n=1 Tax=Azotobacter chroococcum TaxID=353 RepID=UPI00103D7FFC|nr:helix-turn-helix transcriptional regulator [Azotobacter chroococcum]TBW03932.1 hypothetical protein E0E52_13430 [Azotobacter chroococcum]
MIESLQKLVPWLIGLSVVPKLLFSLALVLLTGFLLAVIWISSPAITTASNNLWPQEKTFSTLGRLIDRTSVTNRRLLALILGAGRDGIYAGDLAEQVAVSRDEVVYRAKELASLDLIEIVELTDKNYRIAESVRELLGSSNRRVLEALLQSEEKPLEDQPSSSLLSSKQLFAEIVGTSTVIVGKRAIYHAEFEGDLEFKWHYTQPVKLTDRNVFVELGYPGQTETLTLRVKSRDGRTYSTSKMITAVAPP